MNPVRIVCLKYSNDHFNVSLDIIGALNSLLFTFCQYRNNLEVIDLGDFDPKEHNITSVDQYAQ